MIFVYVLSNYFQSYREYHADIYPDTNGYLPGMGPDDWWKSKCNNLVPKISLDPKKRPKSNLAHFNSELLSNRETTVANSPSIQPAQNTEVQKISSSSNEDNDEELFFSSSKMELSRSFTVTGG